MDSSGPFHRYRVFAQAQAPSVVVGLGIQGILFCFSRCFWFLWRPTAVDDRNSTSIGERRAAGWERKMRVDTVEAAGAPASLTGLIPEHSTLLEKGKKKTGGFEKKTMQLSFPCLLLVAGWRS